VLKFIAEKFGTASYSPEVDTRRVESLSKALYFDDPIATPLPAPALDEYLSRKPKSNPLEVTIPSDGTELQQAFREGLAEMKRQGGTSHPTFGNLLQQVPT
jgi:hypothetical protein